MGALAYISEDAKSDGSPTLLIRHGEKVIPPSDNKFRDVPLTDDGVEESRRLGYELKNVFRAKLKSIHSSPLKRCTMTSEAFRESYEYSGDIVYSNLLGDPGAFIYDDEKAGQTYLETQPDSIVPRHLKEMEMPGFRTPEEGSSLLMDYIISNWSDGLDVMITHDVIIAVLFGYLMGYIPDVEGWIDYLEGVCFFKVGDKIFFDTLEGQFDITRKVNHLLSIRTGDLD